MLETFLVCASIFLDVCLLGQSDAILHANVVHDSHERVRVSLREYLPKFVSDAFATYAFK
jgi:hypothetical protein